MGKPIDITGKKFGKLTVLGVHHLGKRNTRYWLCKCECGKETVQISANLKNGLAYSNFKHNYKDHWGIERKMGKGYPVIVTHWMPLPNSPKKEQK